MYAVKEIYYTIQGEGYHTGRPAIFCRFSGCNLWSGLEKDRNTAICQFCDTQFWGTDGLNGGKYSAEILVKLCLSLWPTDTGAPPFVVCTGGEPLLQLDEPLIQVFHDNGFVVAIESNGTIEVPAGVDWTCISPKANANTIVTTGDELKLVFPQAGFDPTEWIDKSFDHFYLQPMDDENQGDNIESVLTYCRENPKWKVSLQTHKMLNIP